MTTLAQELARRINALSYDRLPRRRRPGGEGRHPRLGRRHARRRREDTTRIPAGVLLRGASGGSSLVFGGSARTNALDAALVNGTAAHALDFDDCNNTIGGHPSAPILPALIALADETGASGRDFIAAYVAGLRDRVQDRAGRALLSLHPRLASDRDAGRLRQPPRRARS